MRDSNVATAARSGGLRDVVLKSPREIELMRAAGRVVYDVLGRLREIVKPGVTTGELGRVADEIINAAGGQALFRGVQTPNTKFPFPAAICASVNEEVVHGIPGDRVLKEGDIISVDCGVRLRGYCGDSATTIPVGRVSRETQRLLGVTEAALELAIAEMRPGRMWSEIASRIQALVEDAGFSVVREFVGHGIGQQMHEEPKVPNYADRKSRKGDFRLEPGLVIAVEPMVNAGTREVRPGDWTGWPQVTRDAKWSAHFEHTVAITPTGVDILTDGR
ncbi:MAG: type I methionyl aminopeptidase [Planctomycetota bacterium]|nr:MAG: type I methionyl aminopeptidase [Planctomycetota bacterium]